MKSKGNYNGENMLLEDNVQPMEFVKGWPQAKPGDFDESETTYPLT